MKVGDTVTIQNSASKENVGKAIITTKYQTTFKDLPVSNGSHESYEDKEHQRNVMSGYYAYLGRPLTDDDPFLVFDFKLL